MKANIHPTWNHACVVTCGCGNTFVTGSGVPTMQVDICSKCHPFFTGEERFVDRQGRVDKFNQKILAAKSRKQTKKSDKAVKDDAESKSYRQILQEQKKAVKSAPLAA